MKSNIAAANTYPSMKSLRDAHRSALRGHAHTGFVLIDALEGDLGESNATRRVHRALEELAAAIAELPAK